MVKKQGTFLRKQIALTWTWNEHAAYDPWAHSSPLITRPQSQLALLYSHTPQHPQPSLTLHPTYALFACPPCQIARSTTPLACSRYYGLARPNIQMATSAHAHPHSKALSLHMFNDVNKRWASWYDRARAASMSILIACVV